MQIPIENGNIDLPDDVKALVNPTPGPRSETGASESTTPLTSNLVLERWNVVAHTYSEKAATQFSLFGGLFSGNASGVKAGLIHEAKRYTIKETAKGRKVEMGVAVRLSVATLKLDGDGSLSLPTLAAKAQLGMADAKIGISVLGYGGAFGDLLPAPTKLDVESFGNYMAAFRKIQAQVFGEASIHYLVPTLLGFQPLDGEIK